MKKDLKSPLLIAYVSTRDLKNLKESDAKAIDIINIAFGHVVEGNCVWEEASSEVDNAIENIRSINPNIRFVLSIGGWSAGGFSEAASTKESREKFAITARELVEKHNLDGIDIDWEYPGIGVAGITATPEDKENFTLYLQAVRDELNKLGDDYLVTIAGGGDNYFCRNTELDKVAEICDYIQIMTYDLRGGFTHATGHHTNLFVPQNDMSDVSVKTAVDQYHRAGVPKSKIVIGVAFYTRLWEGVPNADNGYNQYAETVGGYGPSFDDLKENYIDKDGFIRYWDDVAKAPWLFDGKTFISYEDEESIAHKVKYLDDEGLLGVMYWEYCLGRETDLTLVIRDEIDKLN